jgi:hypothetical protein
MTKKLSWSGCAFALICLAGYAWSQVADVPKVAIPVPSEALQNPRALSIGADGGVVVSPIVAAPVPLGLTIAIPSQSHDSEFSALSPAMAHDISVPLQELHLITQLSVYRDPDTKLLVHRSPDSLDDKQKLLVVEHQTEIARALVAFRNTKSTEADRAAAKQLLAEELASQFELDLNARREAVKVVEKQLEEVKEQLGKRERSKSRLIELKLQLMENESDGLAFPSSWNMQYPARGQSDRMDPIREQPWYIPSREK